MGRIGSIAVVVQFRPQIEPAGELIDDLYRKGDGTLAAAAIFTVSTATVHAITIYRIAIARREMVTCSWRRRSRHTVSEPRPIPNGPSNPASGTTVKESIGAFIS